MFAVIETGGKQYKVTEGDVIEIEKLPAQAGEEVLFDKVLLISQDGDIRVGTPFVESAKILGTKVKDIKGEKVIAFQYRRRKNYKRKVGHRQKYSLVRIDKFQI
ncbi:MAG: 50S ribosomal protein L21 [Chlamydiota bacterium]|nr:50S ribosomal protein L21 [Chlamydiota bacterium]